MRFQTNSFVSIITPTFNRADFIEQAVNSVLGQSYSHFELLIVDDGSTDDTKARLQKALEDTRVQYFYQSNRGQSFARNLALSHAKGDLICFLDSDNYWPETKLERQVALLENHPEVDVVYGDTVIIDEDGKELSRENMQRYSGNIAKYMIRDNCVSMNTAMVRRTCFDQLGGMSGTRRVADDYDLWLRFSARFNFMYYPDFFAFYRVMEDQISSDKTGRLDSNKAIIDEFRKRFPDAMTKAEFNVGFSRFHLRKARYLAGEGKKRQALGELIMACRYRPLDKAWWRSLAAVLLK